MSRYLVLAAWKPELKRLHSLMRRASALPLHIETEVVGVGLIEAGIGAARAITRLKPDRVVLLGTAGAFEGVPFEPPSVVWAERLVLGVPEPESEGQVPAPMPRQEVPSAAWGRALAHTARVPAVTAVCPLTITRAPARARSLATHAQAQVENLEAFAVARAARQARVPLAVILGVSNGVGPQGQAEWREHGEAAAAAACDAFWTWALRVSEQA